MVLRPALLGGVALITVGSLLLLRALGLLPGGVPIAPVVLIALGVVILVGATRRTPAPAVEEPARMSLDGADAARLVLNHGAGTLRIAGGATAGQLFEGRFSGGLEQRVQRFGERVEVTLQPRADVDWLSRAEPVSWDVALAEGIALELDIRTGASRVRADLSRVDARRVTVKTGASDVELVLPAHGHTAAFVSAGAADVRIRVPDGVEATVRNRSALAGLSIDRHRFLRDDGVYRSRGYQDATDRADIDIEGGVASFSVH